MNMGVSMGNTFFYYYAPLKKTLAVMKWVSILDKDNVATGPSGEKFKDLLLSLLLKKPLYASVHLLEYKNELSTLMPKALRTCYFVKLV